MKKVYLTISSISLLLASLSLYNTIQHKKYSYSYNSNKINKEDNIIIYQKELSNGKKVMYGCDKNFKIDFKIGLCYKTL